ncbi:MAG: succinyl-diaminopimelate desuccinylase [Bdellovibrionales bacterium RIFCSPHIGHO2_01_FULL_40_29]|nr:MAG: succinyl-diaminopimelate desuccinylase [Bdellovibrionales bacterium RIFCSPHIGHO2_01_FULL_40_29]OFZ35030.1 MAG: succinyl-diaminopimelate desuccinylase [Bdellovibrionales bacterium RIFCSPHIGHO2_02_FULL_40_15]
MNWIEACRKLISMDSSTSSSTVECVHYLSELAREAGLFVEIIPEMQNGVLQSNIIIRTESFTPGSQEFLLQTHLDTVDAGHFALWKKNGFNPFDATIIDGCIYGLGAAEVKLDFLCKLEVLKRLKGKSFQKLKPVLVGTFGEESGMQGALKLIRKNKVNAKYALIGETSDLTIIHAAKGFAVVEIQIPLSQSEIDYKTKRDLLESTSTQSKIFSGKAAHSSTPHLGENAIVKMLDYLQKMPENMVIVEADGGTRFNSIPNQAMVELDFTSHVQNLSLQKINKIYDVLKQVQKEMENTQDADFEPCHSTLSIGVIRTYEDSIVLGGSCRILPNVTQDHYEQWMEKIKAVCVSQDSKFLITDYKRPFRTSENSQLVKTAQSILEKMSLPTKCLTLPSTNEASLFTRIGIECICFGAGVRQDNVHTPQEHVRIDDLEKSISFYMQMVERFCL